MRDRLTRRVLPRLVVALSQVTWPARTGAALRRALGRRGRVELYVAFDDPCSAVAAIELHDRIAGRAVDLVVLPVARRGIPGDPAADAKRRFAVVDARRLAARTGLELARGEPLPAAATDALAARAAGIPGDAERAAYCLGALRALWLGGGHPADPGAAPSEAVLRRNEARMRRAGPYDTPAAVVHGRWFFAHDRPAQIADWLDELGWVAA